MITSATKELIALPQRAYYLPRLRATISAISKTSMARLRLLLGGLFGHHAHAKRTAGGDGFGAGLFQLAVTVGANPLSAFFFFFPELAAAGAAAKAIVAVAAGLGQLGAGGLDQAARLIEDTVMPPE